MRLSKFAIALLIGSEESPGSKPGSNRLPVYDVYLSYSNHRTVMLVDRYLDYYITCLNSKPSLETLARCNP